MRVALCQPDIAGNVGTILRMAACFAIPVDIIEPCGFPFSDRKLKRAGLDYAVDADISRHADWSSFRDSQPGRLALLTVTGDTALPDVQFAADDILLAGSETAGVEKAIHDEAELRIRIPMRPGVRSLNVAISIGIALGEAMRQTGGWPE